MIGTKPNVILQFKWKSLIVIKFKPKLNLKFMLKGSETIKTMKGSKNRMRLTQVKAIYFAYNQTINFDILWQQGNPH